VRLARIARVSTPPALALACAAAVAGCGGATGASSNAAAVSRPGLDAPAQLSPTRSAPDFTLRDSTGRLVRFSRFRGKAVLLTFIYDHCPDVCPLIVSHLHDALVKLGARAGDAQVVAVSVDPRGDTPRTVKAFLAAHEMTGRMEYLIGSRRELAAVWARYGIAATGTPDSREVSHTALVYGVTGTGKMLALYPADFQPAWIAHDVPLLAAQ
jgi:protein SCO1/2